MVYQSQFIEMFGTIKSPSACDVMTVGDAVERGIIEKPMDGNHGSKHPTADEYVDSGIPFLLANNITEEGVDLLNCSFITKERALRLDKGFAHNGDVLLTHKGTVGRVAVLNCPNYDFVMLTPQVTYYRPLKGLSAEYLKAYFESQGFQEEIMSIASSGATRAYIGITEQRKLHLLIPNTESQCSFVTIVKLADKSKFDGYKSQFIEMFGDIIQDKDQFLKLQELIDKKWITYHLDGNHGGDYPRGEEFVDSGVPYISANCIDGHLIDWSKAKYLTEERAHLLKKGLSINEDVLFAHNATVGPVAILRTKENLVILGTSLTAYRCNKEYILPEYLLAYMDSSIFRSQYEAGMQQSTRNQVPITTQRSYLFLVPPIPAQKKYSALFLQADKSKYLN